MMDCLDGVLVTAMRTKKAALARQIKAMFITITLGVMTAMEPI